MPVVRMAISATPSAATGRSQPGSTSERNSACVLDMVEQNVAETKEFRLLSCYELIAGSRQVDVDDFRETAGIRFECEHPIAAPKRRTSPPFAGSSPDTRRNRVVLPQPDGPTTQANSPGATPKERLSMTRRPPRSSRTPSNAIAASAAASTLDLAAGAARM